MINQVYPLPSKPLTLDLMETLDLYFRRACYHLDLQIRFCSFFVHDSSTEATELARKSPKFPWGPNLEAFTVLSRCFTCLKSMHKIRENVKWGKETFKLGFFGLSNWHYTLREFFHLQTSTRMDLGLWMLVYLTFISTHSVTTFLFLFLFLWNAFLNGVKSKQTAILLPDGVGKHH